ncbi:MAG: ribonuclease Z [Ignavibacteriales bacterium]|nr:ribonuclease Z [Ignavibacteriales bacterium]
MKKELTAIKYPLRWSKKDFSIDVYCSIPNIATGILLKAGKANFIVDPGDGILRDLNTNIGTQEILNISDIFVTHGHHDHVGGVWSLLTYLRVMNKKKSLTIHYPNGCKEIESIYNAFINVYRPYLSYKIKLNKITKTKKISTKNVSVLPFNVIHKEYLLNGKETRNVPAIGYNFTYKNNRICYGGDTTYCEELVKNAKGADLAIIEAGHEDETPDEMHMTLKEAYSIGKSAKKFFLVHVPE